MTLIITGHYEICLNYPVFQPNAILFQFGAGWPQLFLEIFKQNMPKKQEDMKKKKLNDFVFV